MTPLRRARLAMCAAALFVVVSCGGQPPAVLVTPSPGTGSTAGPSASAPGSTLATPAPTPTPDPNGPTIAFEQPTDGAVVPAGDLQMRVAVTRFQIVDKIGNPPAPGEGHVVFYVGVDYVPTQPGRLAHTAPGTFIVSTQNTATWSGLGPGTYGIAAQLVNNDDSALQPPVTTFAKITVQ